MRLASFWVGERVTAGVVVGDLVHPWLDGTTVLDLVRRGLQGALAAGAATVASSPGRPLAGLRLAPPLEPPSVRDFITFEQHVEGALRAVVEDATVPPEWYDAPAFYFTSPHAMIGAYDDVAVPPGCDLLDFELEVAAVVGSDGRDLLPAAAADALFGYTIFNDWSARDLQRREMKVGLGPCKGKDFASTLGPWLVTADELEPYLDEQGRLGLTMTVQVNGSELGRDLLSNMSWTFPELVSYASRGALVRAGDVIGSGTCGGGCLAELWGRSGRQEPAPLQPGDLVTMTVEGIGTIANRVVPGPAATAVPRARRRR